jgi:hypothetical protein
MRCDVQEKAAREKAQSAAHEHPHHTPPAHSAHGHGGGGVGGEDEGLTKSAEFEGYTTLVFALFSISAIVYTCTYVTTYDPTAQALGPKQQNIFRSQQTVYRGQPVPEYQACLDALLHHGFTVTLQLVPAHRPPLPAARCLHSCACVH